MPILSLVNNQREFMFEFDLAALNQGIFVVEYPGSISFRRPDH
jgi:hypothetical protein